MSTFEIGLRPSTPYAWTAAHDVYPVRLTGAWHICCATCNDTIGPFSCRAEAVIEAASHIRAQWPRQLRRPL